MSIGKLIAVGIGPGGLTHLTPAAEQALKDCDLIVGYSTYCDLIAPLVKNKKILSNGMRQEIDRCNAAIDEAGKGLTVSVISSGDAGIYGMAGLLFELLDKRGIELPLEVIPGVTAANAAASILGAPLMNDFAVVSLSDLMTPADIIRKRLKNLAEADMVCVLYNPRSKKRLELFDYALELFKEARGPTACMGFVQNATRENERAWVGSYEACPTEEIDMTTVVLFGNSTTEVLNGHLLTRRGYKKKSEFQESKA